MGAATVEDSGLPQMVAAAVVVAVAVPVVLRVAC
jgi:hypothetical protein